MEINRVAVAAFPKKVTLIGCRRHFNSADPATTMMSRPTNKARAQKGGTRSFKYRAKTTPDINSRSANGSNIFPSSVSVFCHRATAPSKKSVSAATPKTKKASGEPLSINQMMTGIKQRRLTVSALAILPGPRFSAFGYQDHAIHLLFDLNVHHPGLAQQPFQVHGRELVVALSAGQPVMH